MTSSTWHRAAAGCALLALAAVTGGCGATRARRTPTGGIPAQLLRELRPVGRGPRFQPPATGPVVGRCRPGLGRRFAVHVEVFAADRVVVIPAAIGTRPPLRHSAGRIVGARCYGDLVTLDPTGIVLVRAGAERTVADLFRAWGEPLTDHRLTSFHGPHVRAFVGGRRAPLRPGAIPLTPHAEIVLEVGPYVPPHRTFTFPPLPG